MQNSFLFVDDKLSDKDWFQRYVISIFNNKNGREFLKIFNDIMITNSITPYNRDEKETIYRDGFFHLIREINLAHTKYNAIQSKKEVKK